MLGQFRYNIIIVNITIMSCGTRQGARPGTIIILAYIHCVIHCYLARVCAFSVPRGRCGGAKLCTLLYA